MDVLIDVAYLALTLAMFGASAWLVWFCANLRGDRGGRS